MKYQIGNIMLLLRGNKLSLISVPFNKAKRKYLIQYLLNTVKELETFSTDKKCWGVSPDLILILTKLLLNGKGIIFNGTIYPLLKDKTIETDLDTISDMEIYTHAFITQTKSFITAETNNKPKIIADEIITTRGGETGLVYYLQATDDMGLLDTITRIHAIAYNLNKHLNTASPARKEILARMLVPTTTPLLIAIEQIYEVLNEIN